MHKSLSGTCSTRAYFLSLLGREDRRGLCMGKVRESLTFHLLGTHQYFFIVQMLSRNTLLKSTAISKRQRFCYNRINSYKNSFILWRSGNDDMKEKPIHTLGEWTAYFQWLPRSTEKALGLYLSLWEPFRNLCAQYTVLYSLIWISSF